MNHFLRKASTSSTRRRSLLPALLFTVSGGAFLYANPNSDYKNLSISLPIPANVNESLSLPWQNLLSGINHSFRSTDHQLFGNLPSFSSRVSPVDSTDRSAESFGVTGESSKPCCGCLGRDAIANAAATVGPAVVNISVPYELYGILAGKSVGSGAIIDPDGTILTCAHVVADLRGRKAISKGKVEVTLQDGRTFKGTVLNFDLHSDIAIVKIESKTPLPAAKLGSSSRLRPGDWVLALGCPHFLQNTVTAGIVSCVDRKSSDLSLGGMQREYLQTDCAINAGNSGGPLVNVDGEVVGVNILKLSAAEGLGFSVPIDSVNKIIDHFQKNGRVVRTWLGLKMIDLNDMIIAQLKDRDARFPNVHKGVLVPMVTPGSPADRAGFHPGDVVIEFDEKPVKSIKEIIEIMGDRVGVPMKVVVKRQNDAVVTLTVTPEEANPDM
ncbi:Trypsin family protein with PDZ domain [Euphorbia peplus]|nr:Trypsin family protein with PDZ domain [Euphorbia peplus]